MEFSGFDWDSGNLEKCQKHGVSADIIEALFDRPVAIAFAIGTAIACYWQDGRRAGDIRGLYPASPWRRHLHTSDQRSLHA
jgi:hypothetical protein